MKIAQGYYGEGNTGQMAQLMVIDTYTGKVWYLKQYDANNPDNSWQYLGNPVNSKR